MTANGKSKDDLTLFQFESSDQDTVTITVVNRRDIGLYIDTDDGWKVKATRDQHKWNKFRVTGFTPQNLGRRATEETPLNTH